MVAHRKLTSEWRGGGTTVRGSHIRIWLRLHCWCRLCHSACQIRALTAISCGFPAIPKAEQSHSQSLSPSQMMRRHWGMRLKLFHFATISKVKRNLTPLHAARTRAREHCQRSLLPPPDVDFQCDSCMLTPRTPRQSCCLLLPAAWFMILPKVFLWPKASSGPAFKVVCSNHFNWKLHMSEARKTYEIWRRHRSNELWIPYRN